MMKKIIFSTLLLLVLVPMLAFGQNTGTLKGTIIDAEFNEPLPGVNIFIKGTTFGAATNVDGNYEIRNIRPGEYNVEISFVGFERVLLTGIRITAGEETELNYTLKEQILTSDEEVVVVGEAPIFDVEKSSTSSNISRSQIEAAPIRRVEDAVQLQSGVVKDPTGLYIKGGRAYETGYVVDGVSAQDPLAGTGFGLDLGANSFSNIEVITGGVGAEYGDVTSGVVAVQTRDGGDKYEGSFSHKRDNFGSNVASNQANFFTDIYELSIGGPGLLSEKLLPALGLDLPGRISFFATGQLAVSDEYTKNSANQVRSSLIDDTFWSPRQDNRWNGMLKMTYNIKPGMKFQAAYQRSLTVNQNTRMLQITGADVQIRPGYQFIFQPDLDNANTYTHESKLAYVKWTHTVSQTAFYDIQLSRLFTRLRSDANGRDWRPENVDSEFDPESITTFPAREFEGGDDFTYVLAGPGFYNNGGIATLWHDHFAEEITLKSTVTKFFNERQNQLTGGFEFKFNDYQWIDITRPWIGAPIQIDENTFSETRRVGETFDIWRVRPKRGAFFLSDKIRYRGLIATIGARLEYWAPGAYVDRAIDNPEAPIPDFIRDEYKNDTKKIFGQRFKFRLLPKVRVSFPVRENQVLFFNYGHSARIPHPSFVYAGLDPFYQDQSDFPDLGNPNLNPEVDISYEIGLRNQLSANDALNISAFWRDKYDFVTTQTITVQDPTGRPVQRAFRINGDYARSRGVEMTYIKRYRDLLQGQLSVTYSRAEGLSSTNDDNFQNIAGQQLVGNNVETPLAWDRPWDIKGNITFTYDRDEPLFDLAPLNQFRAFLSAVWRSGNRYTPYEFVGFSRNPVTGANDWRPIYERVQDPSKRFSEVGPSWFYMDLNIQKWIEIGDTRLSAFLEITNLLNNQNAIIVNPVTGEGYRSDYPNSQEALVNLRNDRSYDVPGNVRDPRYLDPNDNNVPSYLNPANFLQQRQIMFGISLQF
ncbi:TonB-dependent receptor [Balneola sp. MJW-20]|uniref:TonB-dependent receptor n=1 Tax=Gracilimonas aurantiaca TaxID=3234185 RepID=UPI0034659101